MKNRLPAIALLMLTLSTGATAFAEEKASTVANASEPTYCLFYGREFSEDAELCMRRGRSGSCFHGNWSVSNDDSCEAMDRP